MTIYTDIFRPNDDKAHPAIMAMSPYGKKIGSQWFDDTPNHAEIPMEATSGLQKFEGPGPAYWCNHGYAIINPDVRGAYNISVLLLEHWMKQKVRRKILVSQWKQNKSLQSVK